MSRPGMKLAKLYGNKLPAFRTAADARARLFAVRDERLAKLKLLASKSESFSQDGTPESLKKMEAWYFELLDGNGFPGLGISRKEFEQCMATYFCEVAVMNCAGTEWHVGEFVFAKGRYEIGVRRGLCHVMRDSFRDHYARPANRTRTAIYREYQRYFGR